MDENEREKGGIRVFCEEHTPPENYPEIIKRAMTFALMEVVFRSPEFVDLVQESMEGKRQMGMEETSAMTAQWNEMHPYACCFVGDEEFIRILREDVPKILIFGTESQPLSPEEIDRIQEGY